MENFKIAFAQYGLSMKSKDNPSLRWKSNPSLQPEGGYREP